jgi:hypothetical protein
MKLFTAALLALLAFSVTGVATADNPSLCAKGGWATAQSATGGSFASMTECTRAREVFRPTLTAPAAVTAGETFIAQGVGFHPSTSATFSIAVTGQNPYYSVGAQTNADGTFIGIITFSGCGSAPPYDLTLTVTDSYGVHASAQMTLC